MFTFVAAKTSHEKKFKTCKKYAYYTHINFPLRIFASHAAGSVSAVLPQQAYVNKNNLCKNTYPSPNIIQALWPIHNYFKTFKMLFHLYIVVDPEWFIPDPAMNFLSSGSRSCPCLENIWRKKHPVLNQKEEFTNYLTFFISHYRVLQ